MGQRPAVHPARTALLLLRQARRLTMGRAGAMRDGLSRLIPVRSDRLLIAPQDLRTADPTRAVEIYGGRFVFAGKIVTCHSRPPFALEPPSPEWQAELFGFDWLRHLRAAETALATANARALVDEWIERTPVKQPLAWRTDVTARRIQSFLAHSPLLLDHSDGKFYRRFLRALTRDVARLRHGLKGTADGLPRLQALIALTLAALCLERQTPQLRSASRRLGEELQRQVLPDGGHISRNPQAPVELLLDLLPLRQTFTARHLVAPPELVGAIDRMMLALRSMRHGDGTLGLFNGMGTTSTSLVATLLAYDDVRATALNNMPHTGYQRLAAGTTTVLIDTGTPPPPHLSLDAHAGCLSFEMSSGPFRIVVNCGLPAAARETWQSHARATAAHSTLIVADTSSCDFADGRRIRRWLGGAPILTGPSAVEVIREQSDDETLLSAIHDGYVPRFRVHHRRILTLKGDGSRLDGEDTLVFDSGAQPHPDTEDYAIRFHLHPSVRVTRISDGRSVMLVLPNREAWSFDAPDSRLTLAESVFLAGIDGPRKTTQIVLAHRLSETRSVRWSLTHLATPRPRGEGGRQAELPL